MQVNTRLDEDLLALMVLLEKNRDSILKILVDIGMPLDDESAEWEGIVEPAHGFLKEKKAVGYFLYKLADVVLGITKTMYWTEAIARQHLSYVQNKGLCTNRGKREKDVTIPLISVERKLTFLAFLSIGAVSARMRGPQSCYTNTMESTV